MNANDVVIVSTARTALSKSFRGSFNDTEAPVLGGHVVRAVVERAGIEPGDVGDVIMGAAAQQGTQGYNIGRLCAYTGGLPDTVPGMAIDRMCASGLMSIGIAANGILAGDLSIAVAGGVESLSLTQNKYKNTYRAQSQAVIECMPTAYIPMLETAELVSRRYGISREVQDAYSLQSQQRTAAAQAAGLFADEIVPLAARKLLFDKEGQPAGHQDVIADRDECNRPSTTLADLAALKPVWKDGHWVQQGEFVTAGNASQFSDGASAVLLMSRAEARQRGIEALGVYRGMAVSGCAPEEMGIGPVYAIPKLLKRFGLTVSDIDLWEINEAFAVVPMALMAELSIPHAKVNVNGGACALGHPIGASGARVLVTLLHALQARGGKRGIATLCIGGGEATALAIELL